MTDNTLIELEYRDSIAIFRFNRPLVHNSLNEELMKKWDTYLEEIENTSHIRSIIITGAGSKTFCAGGDLKYFASLKTEKACLEMLQRMRSITNRLFYGKRVVIAAVNGQTFGGGCEILTACHFRIAVPHAAFAFRQATNGILTGWGGGKRLIKLIGKSAALRLLLTGDKFDATEAKDIGFIDKIVEPDALMPEAENLANKINKNYRGSTEAFLKMAELCDYADHEVIDKFESKTLIRLFLGDYFQKILQNYSR